MHRQPRPPLFQPPGNGALLALQARDTRASLASVTVSEMDQPSASVRAVGHPVLDRRCVQTSAALGRPSAADCPSKVARPLHAAHMCLIERCTSPSSVFLHHARISRHAHARRTTPFDCLPSPPPPSIATMSSTTPTTGEKLGELGATVKQAAIDVGTKVAETATVIKDNSVASAVAAKDAIAETAAVKKDEAAASMEDAKATAADKAEEAKASAVETKDAVAAKAAEAKDTAAAQAEETKAAADQKAAEAANVAEAKKSEVATAVKETAAKYE